MTADLGKRVFRERLGFAERIIQVSGMKTRTLVSGYADLTVGRITVAQLHPQSREKGIGLALRSASEDRPETQFARIEVSELNGYEGGPNRSWLDGGGNDFNLAKGPAIAFLIPDAVDGLSEDSPEWRDILGLLEHAETLA